MRKPIAAVILLSYIALYIVIAATIGGMLAKAPAWIQIVYFAIAGVVWAFPLKPLFTWMNTDPKADRDGSN